MAIDRFLPLLGPDDAGLRRDLAFPQAHYSLRFVDVEFWRPFIDLIARRHWLRADHVEMGEPGTFPTFILDQSHVVKLFGAPFDGLRCWGVERDVAAMLDRAGLEIPVPTLVVAGVLSRDPDWAYTVSTFVEGEPFALRRDSPPEEDRVRIARELGAMVREVHDAEIPEGDALRHGWAEWAAFIDRQVCGAGERHRVWGVLPEHLLMQVDRYVTDHLVPDDADPSLVHADLHGHHLLGDPKEPGGWTILGVIDWGDAQAGDRFYELPAVHLGLFHGDKAMLAAFLDAYGWNDHRSDGFVRRAMQMTLLHEFNVLDDVSEAVDLTAQASLDQLADALWRI